MQILLLWAATVFNTYKTWGLYFWHDDFATFYGARMNECIFVWPHTSFCPLFDILYKVFGYHPMPYLILGTILAVGVITSFYFFLRLHTAKKAAFIASLLASTFKLSVKTK